MVAVGSHQPAFMPWPGFWHKFLSCDVFVLSAGVRWTKEGYLNRIRYNGGWMTVPVTVSDTDPICDAVVADDPRLLSKLQKAAAQIMASKKKYPHLDRVDWLFDMLSCYQPGKSLHMLNAQCIGLIAERLNAKTRMLMDTTTKEVGATKIDRLKDRLQRCAPGMTEYVMGAGAATYYDPTALGVPVRMQDPSGFSGEVSIIDVLAGVTDPVDYLMTHGRWHGGTDDTGREAADFRTTH